MERAVPCVEAGLGVATGAGQLTDVAWGGAGPDLQASCQEGYFLLPSEQASYPKKGLQGFLRSPRPAAPQAVQRPPGLPEVREVLPARPSASSSWCSPPSTLLPPSADSSCRCRCFGCCVIRSRAARTEGLGPGTPWPPPARPPAPTRTLPALGAHAGLLGLPLTGSQLPQLSPVRRRPEARRGGRELGSMRRKGWESLLVPAEGLGWSDSSPSSDVVEGHRDLDRDTPPSWGTQGSYLNTGQGAPNWRVI